MLRCSCLLIQLGNCNNNTNEKVIMEKVQVALEVEPPKLNTNRLKENIVKSHLEIIVLTLLSEMSMSGCDLIKEICAKYNIFLNQGTIYSLLYCLKDENIIRIECMKGDMRTKRYCIIQEAKPIIEKRLEEFIETEDYILNSIKKRKPYV
jgi:DNA-binding PadR family transcriptional regulator